MLISHHWIFGLDSFNYSVLEAPDYHSFHSQEQASLKIVENRNTNLFSVYTVTSKAVAKETSEYTLVLFILTQK